MTNKFSSIVRVKKQILDKIEAKLAKARNNVRTCELNIQTAKDRLSQTLLPKTGNISELRQELHLINIMKNDILLLNEKLNIAQKEVMHFTHQYKNANLEYEKMKYLEQEEFKKEIKRIKQKEMMELDEFATIKFSSHRTDI
ncbi:flagellar export protein FliJ [Campylobacter pinnipediorum]|uniref:Flagellar FliJ protein n=1 Tax=Campylobacter pinnipediorum subsp. pinnipediorum TaxID=1660067 RepID=A0AAX0L888_9BACT|nr:flagellar export protein FliJ [Campylobacter pinnipediorum]AQW83653.1 putative flagellar protein FliJ [Campylobacter pinnipediorum subsp. pinnipediorum]OPA75858.1 hypothetical protein BFG04_05275 [Campylobacter pinnipediorum subsp. pinnipediorum]